MQSSRSDRAAVLVTGATGFLGNRLCRRLHERDSVVVAGLRRSIDGCWRGELKLDLAGNAAIELPDGIDTVFHLAGRAHALAENTQDEGLYAKINTDGTRRLLEAARRGGVRAFVFFSTIKAAGAYRRVDRPADESWDVPPETAYGRSKREAERLVLEGGFVPHPVVLRPSLVYGPGVKGNLARMIASVRRGRFPPLPETGSRRSMVHVDDVVEAALLSAGNPAAAGKTYILADRSPCSPRQLFELMAAAAGRRVPRWSIPWLALRMLARSGDVIGRMRGRRFAFDSAALEKLTESSWYSSGRIQHELGWEPRRSIADSIGEMMVSGG